MFARRKWRLHSPPRCHSFVPEGPRRRTEEQRLFAVIPRLTVATILGGELECRGGKKGALPFEVARLRREDIERVHHFRRYQLMFYALTLIISS